MTLIQKIKEDQLLLRKQAAAGSVTAKLYAKLLTTLIGESQIDGKDPSDEHLIKVIQKFIKNIKQSIEIRDPKNTGICYESVMELNMLTTYLPKAVTAEQVLEVVAGNEDLNKGAKIGLVKVFCAENGLLFDGKLVYSLI